MESAEKEAAALNTELQTAEKEMLTLRDQHRAVNDKQRQLDDLRDRLSGAEGDLNDLRETIAAAQSALEQHQAVLARREEIEAGLQQLQQAKDKVKDWDQRLHESYKLSDRKQELDRTIDAAKAEIEAQLRSVTTKIEMLRPKAGAIDTQQTELAEAQTELSALRELETEQQTNRESVTEIGQESARLEEQNKQLKLEMAEIKANMDQLKEAGSNCPVCKRPLDEAHQQEVAAQFTEEGTLKGDTFRSNRARLDEIAVEQKTLQKTIRQTDKQLRALAAVQSKVARLEQSLQQATAAATELETVQAEQVNLQKRPGQPGLRHGGIGIAGRG